MTWSEWLESDYAQEDAFCGKTGSKDIVSVSGYDLQTETGSYVFPTDIIVEGYNYRTVLPSEPE